MPAISASRVSANSFVFVSQSADLRVLDSTLLRPSQIQNYSTSGPMAAMLGMAAIVLMLYVRWGLHMLRVLCSKLPVRMSWILWQR